MNKTEDVEMNTTIESPAVKELSLVETKEGIHTLFNSSMKEHYHSLLGSMQESMHVFIRNGLLPAARKFDEIRILEMGFGTGLNAILSYRENQVLGKKIRYSTIELCPLPIEFVNRLNYFEYFGKPLQPVFLEMHQCNWFEIKSFDDFQLYKIHDDILEHRFDEEYDLVYFDAFSPSHQPKLWQFEVFKKIFDACSKGAALVTYCAKSDVRRTLEAAGFKVEKLPGARRKREMIKATKE